MLRSIVHRLNQWAKHKLFYWLWPVIQKDIIEHPGMWSNALKTGIRESRTLIGGKKL